MQQKIEVVDQPNRFAIRRGRVNNEISTYIQLANQSSDPCGIWNQVEQELIRLSTGSRGIGVPPRRVVQIATDAEVVSLYNVAANLGKDYRKNYKDINRYRRIVGTVLVSVLQREGVILEPPTVINRSRREQLELLHQESDAIAYALSKRRVQRQLKQMPDLKALLEDFQKYSTVKLFLEHNQVPYAPRQIRAFNSDLRNYLFGCKTNLQLRSLLRKTTFSRWLYGEANWYSGGQSEADEAIDKSAEFAYSATPPGDEQGNAKVRYLRFFLEKIIAEELQMVQQDPQLGYRYKPEDIFVPSNGSNITKLQDIDVAKTFGLFASFSYCPQVLKSLVVEYIEGADSFQSLDYFASRLHEDLHYKLAYRKRWIGEGLVFLENALLSNPKESPTWETLLAERREMLRRFRHIFQAVLLDEQTGKGRLLLGS